MSTAAMAAMPDSKAGIASGVLAMNRVLAGALLLAVAGAVFQSQLAGATASTAAEYADAVSVALWPAIVVVAIGTLLTWLLVRAPSAEHPRPPGNEQHHSIIGVFTCRYGDRAPAPV